MVSWRPSTWKIAVSFLAGVLAGAWGYFSAWGEYLAYKEIPGLANYFTLWETIVRNGFLIKIVLGFVVALVVAYIVYSLIQKKSDSVNVAC